MSTTHYTQQQHHTTTQHHHCHHQYDTLIERIRSAYHLADDTHTGYIDKSDMKVVIIYLFGYTPTSAECEAIIQSAYHKNHIHSDSTHTDGNDNVADDSAGQGNDTSHSSSSTLT